MPFLSHFCNVLTDFPMSCPNCLGVYVLSMNTFYYIGICLSTLFILSSHPRRKRSLLHAVGGSYLLSPAKKPLRYIDVALHQSARGTSRGGLFDAPALSIFTHACREVHHSRWV